MIIEGKHLAVGQGIFVSDIQEGSAAEQVIFIYDLGILILSGTLMFFTMWSIFQAGLQVGDMILAVNLDSLLGRTYDEVYTFLSLNNELSC